MSGSLFVLFWTNVEFFVAFRFVFLVIFIEVWICQKNQQKIYEKLEKIKSKIEEINPKFKIDKLKVKQIIFSFALVGLISYIITAQFHLLRNFKSILRYIFTLEVHSIRLMQFVFMGKMIENRLKFIEEESRKESGQKFKVELHEMFDEIVETSRLVEKSFKWTICAMVYLFELILVWRMFTIYKNSSFILQDLFASSGMLSQWFMNLNLLIFIAYTGQTCSALVRFFLLFEFQDIL